jgi:uncharacterized protein YbjT (DUF2867 family)
LPFQLVFGRAYEDKSLQERLIKESGLDWKIVRPGVLTGGPRTGHCKVLAAASLWRNGIVSRADVAAFLPVLSPQGCRIRLQQAVQIAPRQKA